MLIGASAVQQAQPGHGQSGQGQGEATAPAKSPSQQPQPGQGQLGQGHRAIIFESSSTGSGVTLSTTPETATETFAGSGGVTTDSNLTSATTTGGVGITSTWLSVPLFGSTIAGNSFSTENV